MSNWKCVFETNCKQALSDAEVNGDMDLAVDWLRKRGVAVAAKKSDRTANDGLVGLHCADGIVSVVEVNSETDFVARNDVFQSAVTSIGKAAIELGGQTLRTIDPLELGLLKVGNETISELLTRCTATVGESLRLKRAFTLSGDVIGTYVHNVRGVGCGTQVAAVVLDVGDASARREEIQDLANALAMHTVGAQPMFLSSIPEEFQNKEKELEKERLLQELQTDGKEIDPEVAEKRVDKKVDKLMKKLSNESVFINQVFVGLPSPLAPKAKDIKGLLAAAGKTLGTTINIKAGLRVQVGAEEYVEMLP